MFVSIMFLMLGLGNSSDSFSPDGDWLQYANPSQVGFSPKAIEKAYAIAEEVNTAALIVLYQGKVLAAAGLVESRYQCHSIRKSIYSALYGIAVAEGTLDLDKTLADLNIEDIHGLSDTERQATFRDLISARSGVFHPASKEPISMKQRRPERGSHKPGTHFFYNNWDFNTSAMIYEQETGVELFDAFHRLLAKPLGMQDFRRDFDTYHEYDRSASKYPAHAFRLSARDLARMGQLYLQGGVWNKKQILDKRWIRESTATISGSDSFGYGYMWWTRKRGPEESYPGLSAYIASGTGGQMVLVCEELDMVLVHRGDTDHNRHVRDREIMRLFFTILDGKHGEKAANPVTKPMASRPLKDRLPAMEDRKIISLKADHLDTFVGTYRMGDTDVTIRSLKDRLVAHHPLRGELDFFPIGQNHFVVRNANIDIQFTYFDNGSIDKALLNLQGQKIPCPKVD